MKRLGERVSSAVSLLISEGLFSRQIPEVELDGVECTISNTSGKGAV